jgi:hypothetical protein
MEVAAGKESRSLLWSSSMEKILCALNAGHWSSARRLFVAVSISRNPRYADRVEP